MPRPRKLASPFRYFNSSPEVIRLAVLMYVKLNGEMVYCSPSAPMAQI